jgi:hypothetical protein
LFREIALSWERENAAAGKLKVCARICGRGFNPYKSQFADPQLAPGRRPTPARAASPASGGGQDGA